VTLLEIVSAKGPFASLAAAEQRDRAAIRRVLLAALVVLWLLAGAVITAIALSSVPQAGEPMAARAVAVSWSTT